MMSLEDRGIETSLVMNKGTFDDDEVLHKNNFSLWYDFGHYYKRDVSVWFLFLPPRGDLEGVIQELGLTSKKRWFAAKIQLEKVEIM